MTPPGEKYSKKKTQYEDVMKMDGQVEEESKLGNDLLEY